MFGFLRRKRRRGGGEKCYIVDGSSEEIPLVENGKGRA